MLCEFRLGTNLVRLTCAVLCVITESVILILFTLSLLFLVTKLGAAPQTGLPLLRPTPLQN